MRNPVYVRSLTDAERQQLEASLHSSQAFVLCRYQIILAIAPGEHAVNIGRTVGCDDQTVRNVIQAFNSTSFACLKRGSSRPHTTHQAFDAVRAERLRHMLHQSPRQFAKPNRPGKKALPLMWDDAVQP